MSTRTRTKIEAYPGVDAYTGTLSEYNASGALIGLSPFSSPYYPNSGLRTESMTDSTTPSDKTKEVLHTIHDWRVFPSFRYRGYTQDIGPRNEYSPSYPSIAGAAFFNSIIALINMTTAYPKTEAQLKSMCVQKFYSFNEVNSALNVIESPGLVKTISDLSSFFKKLKKGDLKALKKLPSLHLGYAFGVAPLISDLRKLSKEIPNMKSRWEKLRARQGKPYLTSVSVQGTHALMLPGGSNGYYGDSVPVHNYTGPLYWHGKVILGIPPTYKCVIRGVDNSSYSSDAFSRIDDAMSRVTTTGPASLAWELVPFSFVADWFVNTQELMSRLDNTLMGDRKTILDMWTTQNHDLLLPVFIHKYGDRKINFEPEGHALDIMYDRKAVYDSLHTLKGCIGYTRRVLYHRKPIDMTFQVVPSSRFGKKQAALSASLLYQLVANLKK